MGKDLYEQSDHGRALFEQANDILGFRITDIMFGGTEDDLKQTKVTQPAIFLHSVVLASVLGESFQPAMAAGHSLGEFSALVSCNALSFEDGLRLVAARANAMQKACEIQPSTMAAIRSDAIPPPAEPAPSRAMRCPESGTPVTEMAASSVPAATAAVP